jgi:AcrR family transcriptional regulator
MQDIDKKNKKEQIYREAAKLFREKGYKAASMRDLAGRVQLKASSLYSHIGSKEEILVKICFDNAHHFIAGMESIETMYCSVTDKIKSLLLLHIRTAIEDATSVTVFNDEWKHLSEPYLSQFVQLRKDYENRFRAIIKTGVEIGEIKKMNTEILLYSLLNSVQWLHYWYKPDGNIKQNELERDIVLMLMEGIVNHSGQN